MTDIVSARDVDWDLQLQWVKALRPGGAIYEKDWRVTATEESRADITKLADWYQRLADRLHRYADAIQLRERVLGLGHGVDQFSVFALMDAKAVLRTETDAALEAVRQMDTDAPNLPQRMERERKESFAVVMPQDGDSDTAAKARDRATLVWGDACILRLYAEIKARGGAPKDVIAQVCGPFMVRHGVSPKQMRDFLESKEIRDLPTEKTFARAKAEAEQRMSEPLEPPDKTSQTKA